jgi:hypothetical protein
LRLTEKIRPRESSGTANEATKNKGERITSIAAEALTSNDRLAISCGDRGERVDRSEKTWATDPTNASRRKYFVGKKLRPSDWVFFRRRAGKGGKV